MVASLTLLPALLALVGGRIERGRAARAGERARGGAGGRALAALERPGAAPAVAGRAGAADRRCSRSPRPRSTCGSASPTPATTPPSTTSRQAYDLLAEGFGPGFNGPLVVVVDGPTRRSSRGGRAAGARRRRPASRRSRRRCRRRTAGRHDHRLPRRRRPQDAADRTTWCNRLRDDVLPPVARDSGATFLVGGSTAAAVDFADAVGRPAAAVRRRRGRAVRAAADGASSGRC